MKDYRISGTLTWLHTDVAYTRSIGEPLHGWDGLRDPHRYRNMTAPIVSTIVRAPTLERAIELYREVALQNKEHLGGQNHEVEIRSAHLAGGKDLPVLFDQTSASSRS